ncbi:Uma2 family endonuclease [Catalinimonas sp. 4WD22]|uniref:Uma2 family endonuclease n=1 Tax=Catalinimonas locisalis TaxID=3133978 RepID=UPI003101589A
MTDMAVGLERHTINTNTYHRMIELGMLCEEDKVELIHGEIIKKSPIGKKHASVVDRINKILNNYLKDEAIVRIQSPISIPQHSEPEPDISLLKADPDFYVDRTPQPDDVLFVIEVADSSWDYDYEIKRPLYASAGIAELWLVNLNKNEIEVHRTPAPTTYKNISIHQSGDKLALPLPNLQAKISLNSLLGLGQK